MIHTKSKALTDEQCYLARNMSEQTPLYRKIAGLLTQLANCRASNNELWQGRCEDSLTKIMQSAPSGSGFDSGTYLLGFTPYDSEYDVKKSANALRFQTSFHHMNDVGMYDGWTEHIVTVKADLLNGFDITVSGRNKNDIKDYIHEIFNYWLSESVPRWDDYTEDK